MATPFIQCMVSAVPSVTAVQWVDCIFRDIRDGNCQFVTETEISRQILCQPQSTQALAAL